MAVKRIRTIDVLSGFHEELLAEWLKDLQEAGALADSRNVRGELNELADRFLRLLGEAARRGNLDVKSDEWAAVRQFLTEMSATRVRQGYNSVQTAVFIFSLKRAVFAILRREPGNDAQTLADETWAATKLLDELGLLSVTAFQSTREEVIARQQHELLELSTPVVKLWEGILAIPMIGTLDSARTQIMMESLLERIVETGAPMAILDITGVPTVDTLVAQHLLKTVTAIRLMGGDCIISGVRPQIAQTIVHLGLDLQGITTKATLADALTLALRRTGQSIVRVAD
jgi:rsbT co-antagonist protein RsbR